ncbi:hypothetical protein ES332_D02G019700v1 [Gossypium tomentosum]|uniref:Zinc finger PHD-type domain-containing protein n=1 Tax=Gossypium tomentosum TaxID=34277 RepID=A0A5D2LR36_GOSTO|nr:hypothetical protein ES332_D02G019700v1 [Gossypium tomentosum]
MEESNNYGHQHPLLLILNQDQLIHNQSGVTHCSRCGEEVSVPCFCCVEHCGFYAPLELKHPFHPHHPLVLLQEPPSSYTRCVCDFCDKTCEKFIYHCSCGLDFHIKCALFTFNVAENNLKELDHVALRDPLIPTENRDEELENVSKCFGCWEPLANYTHFSPECGFNLHEKCAELPFKLNHECHREHPLVLQFNSERLPCQICLGIRRRGFVYGCSPCQFVVHIECASQSPPPVIKSTNHEHPFTLFNGHQHPLLLMLNQEQLIHNQSGVTDCSRCGEKVSAPCFSCAEHCGFYLHKVCAAAPVKLNHPFHLNHPLLLMQKSPHLSGAYFCSFCHEFGDKSVYHCSSCKLDFHIKCALFTFNIAENNLKELDHVALRDPVISTENGDDKLEDVSKCFGCREPLANYTHFSPYRGFNLHEKCAKIPFKLNHVCHRKHPLVLQFNSERLSCKICQVTRRRGFVYGCSSCKFVIHIECLSPSPIIKDEGHQHPFSLLLRQVPFICDACGTEGNHVAYTCGTCNIIVHKNCISLPRIIKSKWHDHGLLHKYFHYIEDFRVLYCIICHDEVNTEHGSYYCSKCNFIFHVKCVMKDEALYEIVENEDDESPNESASSITQVLQRNDAGEATVIEHFKHSHHLMLSDGVGEYDNKCCDGCLLPIVASFYYCTPCDFFLHKVCVELPKVKHVWHHRCRPPLILTSNEVFRCVKCDCLSNAFAYKCEDCKGYTCLRCVIALTPGVARTCLGHKHPLLFFIEYRGRCVACGDDNIKGLFRCKDCDFSLHHKCYSLPIISQHKSDEHLLSLAYNDDNSYSESHFCDVCEERRDPKLSFYHCATCDTSAHVNCVLGEHPFIKLGSTVAVDEDIHGHPLTIVKKIYYYPNCSDCGKPCLGLALECTGCNFIVHAECPSDSED